MTPSTSGLDSLQHYSGQDNVAIGNGSTLSISHTGRRPLTSNLQLLDVLVVPHLTKNLLSISKLCSDYPVDVIFSKNSFAIQNRSTKQVLEKGRREHGLYLLDSGQAALLSALSANKLRASFSLWHSRLGHLPFDIISHLNKLGFLHVTSVLPTPGICSSCQMAKSKHLPYVLNEKRALFPLELIHCDLWGPAPVKSVSGYAYYVIFVDDFSRFTWFYPMRHKSEFFDIFLNFQRLVENQLSTTIKVFQSDGGTEFNNNKVRSHFLSCGIRHQLSCPYTPAQNGHTERKHRYITETGLAMMFHAHAPSALWVEAFASAVYIINRLPSSVLQHTSPYEILFGTAPNYANFHPFGCQVFPYLRDYSPHKLAPRSLPCIFLGYSTQHKGFCCLDPVTSRIYISRHAQFNESIFPFAATNVPRTCSSDFSEFLEPFTAASRSSPSECTTAPAVSSSTPLCKVCSAAPPPQNPPPDSHTPADPPPQDPQTPNSPPPIHLPETVPRHHMVTRARAGIFKPCHIVDVAQVMGSSLLAALITHTEPKGFKSAAKNPVWLSAMDDEMNALRRNNT